MLVLEPILARCPPGPRSADKVRALEWRGGAPCAVPQNGAETASWVLWPCARPRAERWGTGREGGPDETPERGGCRRWVTDGVES